MRKNKYLKAMSVVEYSMLIEIVVATLKEMEICLKRAVSGRWRPEEDGFRYGRIYAP